MTTVSKAYYHDHREEIEDEFRRERELADQMRAQFPPKLRGKLGG